MSSILNASDEFSAVSKRAKYKQIEMDNLIKWHFNDFDDY